MSVASVMRRLTQFVVILAALGAVACAVIATRVDAHPLDHATPIAAQDPLRITLEPGHQVVVYGPLRPESPSFGVSAQSLGCSLLGGSGATRLFSRLSPLDQLPLVEYGGRRFFPLFEVPRHRTGHHLSCTALGAQTPLLTLDGGTMGTDAIMVKVSMIGGALLLGLVALSGAVYLGVKRLVRPVPEALGRT